MNTLRYAKWMEQAGKKVTVFVIDLSRMHQEAIRLELPVVIIQKHKKYFDFKSAQNRAHLFDQLAIEVIWFRDNYDFDLLSWAKRFSKQKFKLIYQQAMQLNGSKKGPIHFLQYKSCDAWVATLPYLAQQVGKLTHMNKHKIHVVPLGVELAQANSPKKRSDYNIPADALVMGIIGRLDPKKDQMTAIHALQLLRSRYPHLHLVIIGESTLHEGHAYESELKRKVNHFDLQERVHFLPFSSNIANEFGLFDLFLMTSLGETFGTVTIESMGYGVPVIGTNTSGTPELLDQGNCGLLYTPQHVDELVEKIILLADQPILRASLKEKALHRFNEQYSKQASIKKMLTILNQWT